MIEVIKNNIYVLTILTCLLVLLKLNNEKILLAILLVFNMPSI